MISGQPPSCILLRIYSKVLKTEKESKYTRNLTAIKYACESMAAIELLNSVTDNMSYQSTSEDWCFIQPGGRQSSQADIKC